MRDTTSDRQDVDEVAARVRAARHATSLPILVLGVVVLLVAIEYFLPRWAPLVMFISPIGSVALWVAANAQAKRVGLGTGREHYGLIALAVVLLSIPLLPLTLIVDPAFLFALSLVVIGWRGRDRSVWGVGLVVAALSPLLYQTFVRDLIQGIQRLLTGAVMLTFPLDGLILGALGVTLLLLGARHWNRERRLVRG